MQQHLRWWQDLLLWQTDLCPVVMVTVVRADGSTPREVGATMLVRVDPKLNLQQSDTIGGGHLEFQAIDIAQAMLNETEQRARFVERFNLSARLGQCCGGVMWILFEKLQISSPYGDLLDCQKAWQHGKTITRLISDQAPSSWYIEDITERTHSRCQFQQDDSQWQYLQKIQPYAMQVMLFGAGHVGEAIVRCLLPIGVNITWVDNRDDIFPSDLLDQVTCISTDVPDAQIRDFDRAGAILILTHDHQLDLQLCFEALKPNTRPFAYVGMIGSKSKRAIFEKRMQARGYTDTELQRLVCPIGIEGISSKQPAIIAVAVVAELLQVFDVKK